MTLQTDEDSTLQISMLYTMHTTTKLRCFVSSLWKFGSEETTFSAYETKIYLGKSAAAVPRYAAAVYRSTIIYQLSNILFDTLHQQ